MIRRLFSVIGIAVSVGILAPVPSFSGEGPAAPQVELGISCGDAVRSALMRLTGLRKFQAAYVNAMKEGGPENFWARLLKQSKVAVDFDPAALEHIPATGPALVFANHPTGLMDGPAVASLVHERRSDVKVMVNGSMELPGLEDQVIRVKVRAYGETPDQEPARIRQNLTAMKDAMNWLKQGHSLVVFPSGEISHINKFGEKEAFDRSWNRNLASFATKTGASVVPVYVHGQNGRLFQLSGLVNEKLRTAQIGWTASKLEGKSMRVEVGPAVSAKELGAIEGGQSQMDYLRGRTYALKNRASPPKGARDESKYAPIPPGFSKEEITNAIQALGRNHVLVQSGDVEVLAFSKKDLDEHSFKVVMDELGRLREVTFRGVGEGSGKARDLDPFDDYYTHLIVWNKKENEMVGAYRIGFSDRIVAEKGIDGLYTHSQFKYGEDFLNQVGPVLELGRSFVRPEYQGHPTGLPMLFKGIAAVMANNPHYRGFFGSASISNAYDDISKQVMIDYLRAHQADPALSKLVSITNPPKLAPVLPPGEIHNLEKGANTLSSLNSVVAGVEPDGKGMPPLISTYSTLQAKFLAFDFDPGFNTVDGFIVVNLRDVAAKQPALIKRLMGKESYERYINAAQSAGSDMR